MEYLECFASNLSIYPEGTLLKRARVSTDLVIKFIEWQREYDPAAGWRVIDFSDKNIHWSFNMKSTINNEWVFDKKWKMITRRFIA